MPLHGVDERPGVVSSYGSTPGELAVCLRNVGLVDRADLVTLRQDATPATLEALTGLSGQSLAVGAILRLGDAWCARPTSGELLVVGTVAAADRFRQLLRLRDRRSPGVAAEHEGGVVLEVVGARTVDLLRALGVYSEADGPRGATPCAHVWLAGAPTTWIHESDVSSLCCVRHDDLDAVRRLLSTLGHTLGMGNVGHEALHHYEMLERRRMRTALPSTAHLDR